MGFSPKMAMAALSIFKINLEHFIFIPLSPPLVGCDTQRGNIKIAYITLNEFVQEKHETFISACTYSEAKCTKQVFSFAEKWQRHKIADCNGVQWREYVQGAIN